MHDFKAGDKVVCMRQSKIPKYNFTEIGEVYTISEVVERSGICIEEAPEGKKNSICSAYRFKLYKNQKEDYPTLKKEYFRQQDNII